jgi:very-short-patch-repair endonuclease
MKARKPLPMDPLFAKVLSDAGIPLPEPEWRFFPPRRWRLDYAWVDAKVGLEVDGAVWVQGRHTRGSGFTKDQEKKNKAAAMGWRMLSVVPQDLYLNTTIELIKECLR